MYRNLKYVQQIEKKLDLTKESDYERFLLEMRRMGFANISDYETAKKKLFIASWVPEVHYIDFRECSAITGDAVVNNKYGVYITQGEGVHAFVGSQPINYELCESLNVGVIKMSYEGGTIICSARDLSVMFVAPKEIGFGDAEITGKLLEIISKYVPNAVIDGNDILVDGAKVSGCTAAYIGESFVWTTQVSFADYSDYIAKVCTKPAKKTPSYIDSNLLSRETLEKEFLAWLRKENTV